MGNNFRNITAQVFRNPFVFNPNVSDFSVFVIGGCFYDQSFIIVLNNLGFVISLTHCVGLLGISAASPSPVGGVAAAPSKNGGAKSIIVPSFYTVFGAIVLGCLSMVLSIVADSGVIAAV